MSVVFSSLDSIYYTAKTMPKMGTHLRIPEFVYTKKAAGFLLRRGHLLKGGRVA